MELWTAVSGLLALISKAYRNFSLWHHEFIEAKLSAARAWGPGRRGRGGRSGRGGRGGGLVIMRAGFHDNGRSVESLFDSQGSSP